MEKGLDLKLPVPFIIEDKPLISIITVVYNGVEFLEETILSVINQTYPNVEYIIIDGGSTDGTVDIIKKYEDKIAYWVSEKDSGIYDAMNKGLKIAQGDYIAILNADDYYLPNAIELSIQKIKETDSDYSFAEVRYVNSTSKICPIFPLEQNKIYQEMLYPHVSALILKKIYDDVGYFDTDFKIAGDHDMALRIHLKNYKYCYVSEVIAELEAGGVSSSNESNKESLAVAIKNGKNKVDAYFTYYKQMMKVYLIWVLPKRIVRTLLKAMKSRFQ